MLTFILQPYSRVNTENPYPILDLFPDTCSLVVVLPAIPIFKCRLPRNFLRQFFKQLISLRKMIPYSRPELFDFYTLFESKLAENHTLYSGKSLYSSYMGVPPQPRTLRHIPVLLFDRCLDLVRIIDLLKYYNT